MVRIGCFFLILKIPVISVLQRDHHQKQQSRPPLYRKQNKKKSPNPGQNPWHFWKIGLESISSGPAVGLGEDAPHPPLIPQRIGSCVQPQSAWCIQKWKCGHALQCHYFPRTTIQTAYQHNSNYGSNSVMLKDSRGGCTYSVIFRNTIRVHRVRRVSWWCCQLDQYHAHACIAHLTHVAAAQGRARGPPPPRRRHPRPGLHSCTARI